MFKVGDIAKRTWFAGTPGEITGVLVHILKINGDIITICQYGFEWDKSAWFDVNISELVYTEEK